MLDDGRTSRRPRKGLKRAAGFLRSQLAQRLKLYTHAASCASSTTSRSSAAIALVAPDRRGERRSTNETMIDGVLLLDKPLGLSSNAALQEAKRLLARREGRPRRHARSAGLRTAAGAASARRPSSPGRCSTPTRTTSPRCSSARRTTHRRCRRRGAASSAPVAVTATQVDGGAGALSRRDRAGAADAFGAQARRRAALQATRARATTVERAAAPRARSTSSTLLGCAAADGSSCASAAARAPTSARSPRTSARRSAPARTSRRCAAPLGRFRVEDARHAGGAARACRTRERPLLPLAALLAGLAAHRARRRRRGAPAQRPGR